MQLITIVIPNQGNNTWKIFVYLGKNRLRCCWDEQLVFNLLFPLRYKHLLARITILMVIQIEVWTRE